MEDNCCAQRLLVCAISSLRSLRPASPAVFDSFFSSASATRSCTGVTGSVDVEVDDLPTLYAAAVIPGGISYDSGAGDALTLFTAPSNTAPIGVPLPFTVTALTPTLSPASGVTVIYTVTAGITIVMCAFAALLSIVKVLRLDPASVFKG